uniref:Uncharacterized protein n=1 Tax=Molossus molossus TaxID=27622 RepID=A0A7J8HCT3_MOLMO|nr:hypothetical protein HJG59_011197 [Molossus molossus]
MTTSVLGTSRCSPWASASGFRMRIGSFSGTPGPLPFRKGADGVSVSKETGPATTSLPLTCLDSQTVGRKRGKLSHSHDGGRERLRTAHAPAQRPASIYVGDPTWRLRRPWRWRWSPSEHSGGEGGTVRTHGGVGGDG